MPHDEDDALWYPSVDDILQIHRDIIDEDPEASSGVHDRDRIQYAIDFVSLGHFDEVPETIHEKAFHLMRLLASNHWFVDGNKRTALNVTELFYLVNGYELDYGEDLRSILKLFSVRESLIDRTAGPTYLEDQTDVFERENPDNQDALAIIVVKAVLEWSDVDAEEFLEDDDDHSPRHEFGLTTDYDGTVNIDEEGSSSTDGSR